MAISVGGLLSGLDTTSILSQLMDIERRPATLLNNKKETYNTKLSAFQDINAKLSSLLSVVKGMDTNEEFNVRDGEFVNNNSNDNNAVISLSATSSVSAGNFNLVVSRLALADKWIHEGVNDQDAAISGTAGDFTFTYNDTTTDISVSTSTTLVGLKNAINSANTDVTATIINTGAASNNYKLVLTGDSTGENNTIEIDATSIFGSNFSHQQTAQNSTIELDGLTISKESNLLTDVVEGASIILKSVGSGTITFSNDMSAVTGKINQFISSYNDLISFLNKQLSYDVTNKTTGTLFANPTVVNLQRTLKNIITDNISGLSGTYTRLSQIGISTDKSDGTLSLKDSELADALANDFEGVTKLFTSFGSASDSRVTFTGFTADTEPGTYNLTGLGGFAGLGFSGIAIQKDGETESSDMNASSDGRYFSGVEGSSGEGLNIRAEGDNPGSYGTVSLSLGVAAQLTREIDILLDQSQDGPVVTEMNSFTDTMKEIDVQIDAQSIRLTMVQDRLKRGFLSLETSMARLKSQGDFLTSALSGLSTTKK